MQVYFRHDQNTRDEFEICKKYFPTVDVRTKLEQDVGEKVICRYSALPFYRELEEDLRNMSLMPINSYFEHSYIAEMDWTFDLKDRTFPTYDNLVFAPEGQYIVKGRTNSRKFQWNTLMFAPDKRSASIIAAELMNDPLIASQGVVFRKYIPLVTYEVGINDMPMTNEWRCFFYKDTLIDYGFYWSIMDDQTKRMSDEEFEKEGLLFAIESAKVISNNTCFFAIDVAQGQDGKWYVVEVNDGQMSGLSTIPAERFYSNLDRVLNEF